MRVSRRELDRALRKWQRLLRVEDWRVHAYFVHGLDVDRGYGQAHIFTPKRQAIVRIVTPEDRSSDPQWEEADPGEFDWEVTLVHELLHVRFAELALDATSPDTDDDVWKPWEPVIHAIATAMIAVDRAEAA